MFRPTLTILVALAAVATAHAADETYTLKFYQQKEGDVTKKTMSGDIEGKLKVSVGEKTDETPFRARTLSVETAEILKCPPDAKHVTKWKRTFEKAESTDAEGKTTHSPLTGKTVVTEIADGKSTHTIDDKSAPADLAASLGSESSRSDSRRTTYPQEWLPTQPVKVGESWDLEVKMFTETTNETKGMIWDPKKSSFTGKLLTATKKDGALWGKVEFKLRVELTHMANGTEKPIPVEDGSKASATVVVEACLDGTTPGESSEMAMEFVFHVKLPEEKRLIAMKIKAKASSEPVTKK